nr:hypothetical protein [Tanacetum cinerariifolium]
HEEGKESDDDSDEGSDNDSEETVKSGAGKDDDDDDDEDDDYKDEEEELAKDDEEDKETGKGSDEVRESEGESEEEEGSFDPIPRTPEDNKKESDDEEEQESRLKVKNWKKQLSIAIRYSKQGSYSSSPFREMLHISPRIPNQPFADLPTEEEVLDFLRFLGHSHDIRYLTDVNVNKLYQPWRSFASVINKCLTGKSSGVDSFRLSQAQMLWGFYHRINIDFAYLIWEDFLYQVEHKRSLPSRDEIEFIGITFEMMLCSQLLRWYRDTRQHNNMVRYDQLSSQLLKLGTVRIIRSTLLVLWERQHLNQRRVARKKKCDSASSTTPPTPTPTTTAESALRLSATAKGKQPLRATTPIEPTDLQRTEAEQLKTVLKRSRRETHISQLSGSGTGEGTGSKPGVSDVPSDDSEKELSWKSSDDEKVGGHEEGKESDDDSDKGSDNDSDETVKSGAGKDGDEDEDEEEEI